MCFDRYPIGYLNGLTVGSVTFGIFSSTNFVAGQKLCWTSGATGANYYCISPVSCSNNYNLGKYSIGPKQNNRLALNFYWTQFKPISAKVVVQPTTVKAMMF